MTNAMFLAVLLLTNQPATNSCTVGNRTIPASECWTAVANMLVTNSGRWVVTWDDDLLPAQPIISTNKTGITTNGWIGMNPQIISTTLTNTVYPTHLQWVMSVPKWNCTGNSAYVLRGQKLTP